MNATGLLLPELRDDLWDRDAYRIRRAELFLEAEKRRRGPLCRLWDTKFPKKNQALYDESENIVREVLRNQGWSVTDVRKQQTDTGRGPVIYGPDGTEYRSTDFEVSKPGARTIAVEVKSRRQWTWWEGETRNRVPIPSWQTGEECWICDKYLEMAEASGKRCYLAIWAYGSIPQKKDIEEKFCPPNCPTGLYISPLAELISSGRVGRDFYRNKSMYYWKDTDFDTVYPMEWVLASTGWMP